MNMNDFETTNQNGSPSDMGASTLPPSEDPLDRFQRWHKRIVDNDKQMVDLVFDKYARIRSNSKQRNLLGYALFAQTKGPNRKNIIRWSSQEAPNEAPIWIIGKQKSQKPPILLEYPSKEENPSIFDVEKILMLGWEELSKFNSFAVDYFWFDSTTESPFETFRFKTSSEHEWVQRLIEMLTRGCCDDIKIDLACHAIQQVGGNDANAII